MQNILSETGEGILCYFISFHFINV